MTQPTDQDLYAQWREDYALEYEPNYDEHLEADCKAAFLAGMQTARRAQVVPQWMIDEVVPAIDPVGLDPEKHHCEYVLYQDRERIRRALAAAPQPPEGLKRENPATKPEANSAEFDRIEAAPVPKFNHAAKRKLELLLEAGEEITGYAIQNKDGRRGAIDCRGFVYWWNDAAPVQMPEPAAYLHECGKKPSLRTLEFSKVDIQLAAKGYKSIPLYTEHQVRQLLSAHGIKQPIT